MMSEVEVVTSTSDEPGRGRDCYPGKGMRVSLNG